MNAGGFDVLEHDGDPCVLSVAERIDVELECAFDVAVDEAWAFNAELCRRAGDMHAPAAEHVMWTHEHRIAEPLGNLARLVGIGRGSPLGCEVADDLCE